MRATLSRWMLLIMWLCLPLVAIMGCDEEYNGDGFNMDSILAIIYAVGDVVVSIIQAAGTV
jgi:hypothetical protein